MCIILLEFFELLNLTNMNWQRTRFKRPTNNHPRVWSKGLYIHAIMT